MPTLDRPRIEYRTPVDLVAEVQRGFKWETSDVLARFDSILRGFPIGNLLLWRRPAPTAGRPLDLRPGRIGLPVRGGSD